MGNGWAAGPWDESTWGTSGAFGTGWGAGPWGASAWGGSPPGTLRLLQAVAARENVIQVDLSTAVHVTGLFDPGDASDPRLWTVTADPTTTGLDGLPARPVGVVAVQPTPDIPAAGAGRFLDVLLDRPMSPYPAVYTVAAAGLVADPGGEGIDPLHASARLYGARRFLEPQSLEGPQRGGDIACPQTVSSAARARFPNPGAPGVLGTYRPDDTGDYALDRGIDSLKKRMLRRAVSAVGGFLHLRDYGVGVRGLSKQLATSARVAQLTSRMEQQVAQEPEVAKARVTLAQRAPGLFHVTILAQLRSGAVVKFGSDLSLPLAA